jgi:hypothetical protein
MAAVSTIREFQEQPEIKMLYLSDYKPVKAFDWMFFVGGKI